MLATLHFASATVTIDLAAPHLLAIPMDFDGPQPSAFGLSPATQAPLSTETFTTEVARGGAVNCMQLTLWPHGNGTHTETVGHLLRDPPPVGLLTPGYQCAALLSVPTVELGQSEETYPAPARPEDVVVTRANLLAAWRALPAHTHLPDVTALAIRTLPYDDEAKASREYSNPPFLTIEAMQWITHELGIKHLLIDLPSVDREYDDGLLSNHRTFWHVQPGATSTVDENPRRACTITEMILAPAALLDHYYVLALELPALLTDAAPSRPILYDITTPSPV